MRRILVAAALGLVGFTAAPASALDPKNIFKAERQDELCVPAPGGRRVVAPGRLVKALIDEAAVPLALLDRANDFAIADDVITFEEMRRAVTREFTPAFVNSLGARDREAVKRLTALHGLVNSFLAHGGDASSYQAMRDGKVVTPTPLDPTLVRQVLAPGSGVVVVCVVSRPDPSTPTPSAAAEAPPSLLERFVLRGKAEELGIPRSELKARQVKTADLSFKRDERADTDTFKVNATGGFVLLHDDAGRQLIGYVKYERTDVTPDSKSQNDVEVVGPGVLGTIPFTLGPRISGTVGIAGQAVLDQAQDSEQLKIRAFATPVVSIPVGERSYQLFGGELFFGRLSILPNVRPLVEFAHVVDKGSNSALEVGKPYGGLGLYTSLGFTLPETPFLSNFVLGVDYWHLQLYGARLANAHRLTTSLAWVLDPYVTFKLAYEDGNNVETFQKERYWNLSVGVRY